MGFALVLFMTASTLVGGMGGGLGSGSGSGSGRYSDAFTGAVCARPGPRLQMWLTGVHNHMRSGRGCNLLYLRYMEGVGL